MNKSIENLRFNSLDVWRGIAIIIMIFANSSAYALSQPHFILIRLFFSLAAPLFIFMSGFSYTISKKNSSNKIKYLSGLYVIITATLVDLFIWRIIPFSTFDVLYILGIGIIINTIIKNLNWKFKIFFLITIFCFYLYIIHKLNYRFEVFEIDILNLNNNFISLIQQSNPFKRFIIDGWFPVFPWLGLIVLGTVFAEKRTVIIKHYKIGIVIGVLMTFIGVIFIISNPIIQSERNNYLELFYPPSIYFILLSIGMSILVGINISLNKLGDNFICRLLSKFGRKSLFIYILHCFIIQYLIKDNFSDLNLFKFLLLDIIFISVCYYVLKIIDKMSKNSYFESIPKPLKKIFGI